MTKTKKPGPKVIDWDGIAAAYGDGTATLKELGEQFSVSASAISQRARKEEWPARAHQTKGKRKTGSTFESRLARTLDRQITEIEDRWSCDNVAQDAAQAEKEARTLNVLIRTAEKLKELQVMTTAKKAKQSDTAEHATSRLDRKRLRETLERRLDQLLATADAAGLPRVPQD